jgi:hypothetical protein
VRFRAPLHRNFILSVLLIVPILFTISSLKKEYFTNVLFLKALSYSNQKELTNKEMVAPHLPITLLLFIILAFAQPFLSPKTKKCQ